MYDTQDTDTQSQDNTNENSERVDIHSPELDQLQASQNNALSIVTKDGVKNILKNVRVEITVFVSDVKRCT